MGTSGSGKTTALKYLDAAYTRLFPTARHYVLDTKIEGGDFADWPGAIISDSCPAAPGRNQRYQVWRVARVLPEEMERWLYMVRNDPPAILEIDELASLTYKRGEYSEQYNLITKWGRGLPVGSIALSQELSRIPPNAYKQSTHRFGFYLDGRYDKLIRNDMLKWKVEDPADTYGFYYQHINGRGEPRYHRTIQEFLGL
jgi:hypothetical protein